MLLISASLARPNLHSWLPALLQLVSGHPSLPASAALTEVATSTSTLGSLTPAATRSVQTAALRTAEPEDYTRTVLTTNLFDDEKRKLLTPAAVVSMLDKYIVGQHDAKRAVAVALRNRWRRLKVPNPMRDEIMPKNILMVGPTGCGKTEIARRLAKLADAPFIKVEATKYTELGYVGRDVDDIIKDLVENSIQLVRQRLKEKVAAHTSEKAENLILEGLVGSHDKRLWEPFRQMYREGQLDNSMVEVDLPQPEKKFNFESGSMVVLESIFRSGGQGFGNKQRPGEKKKMKVGEAKARIQELEAEKLLQSDIVVKEALHAAETDGIVFIDEIDKIVEPSARLIGGNVSSEGVQRDLLPIIEGSIVQTKHGNVNTDHILFICSGAFHSSKPTDMLAELQGRLPIRVELKGLTAEDFYKILTEPENNMIRQQKLLLATEGVDLEFTDAAIHATARMAEQANRLLDNIGARRLHTVLERILMEISFSAPEKHEEALKNGDDRYHYLVDENMVEQTLEPLLKKQDLSRYVL